MNNIIYAPNFRPVSLDLAQSCFTCDYCRIIKLNWQCNLYAIEFGDHLDGAEEFVASRICDSYLDEE